ncbi:MAG: tetratricopeptide repeat protein [Cyanobacteria bacterium J06623_7]
MTTSTSPSKANWLDLAETSALVVSLCGSVTSVIFKQFLWVTVPLSVSAGLAAVNHQRLRRAVKSEQEAITFLIQENRAQVVKLKEQTEHAHWKTKANLNAVQQSQESAGEELKRIDRVQKTELAEATQDLALLQISVDKLTQLTKQLEQEQHETRQLAKELKIIEKCTQLISQNFNLAQSYFQRGSAYQRSGNIQRAIDDFTRVIELENDHVLAHHQRGLLYREIGQAQQAIIDLRRASQQYISQSNLDKYRETRDLALQIYGDRSNELNAQEAQAIPQPATESESVVVSNLFD